MAAIENTDQVTPSGYALPFGTSQADLNNLIRINAEQFRKLYPSVDYNSLTRTVDGVSVVEDNIYKEKKFKTFKDAVSVPCLISYGEQEKLAQRYGVEETQVASATFCNRINEELGIDPITGDQLEYLGIKFEIMTVEFSAYFLNTQVPLNKFAVLRNLNQR